MKKLLNRRNNKRGFTLIELLVVVLILAILMAIALPLYLSAVADSEVKTCRSNMQTIANAVQAYRVKNRDTSLLPAPSALTGDLGAVPICPKGGTYSVGSGGGQGFTVTCTGTSNGTAHGSYTPGVDGS
ncbi:MAG TPA: prepilin-type N-terminal cleavage/methylation domain-containing protein [Fimbriimonadaceae bacterium]|nr:prepilin-type N-terminal cleavage/methylation domain-containing protein [Fimbriimonadaceae bacterium]